jgi:hypothetical protein
MGGGWGVYGVGPRLGENIELALEFRDRLNLSEDQVAALQKLQQDIQRDVTPLETEIEALRGLIRNGDVAWTEGVGQLQDLFTRYDSAAEPYRTGVARILSGYQHSMLQGMMYETRLGSVPARGLARPGLGLRRGRGLGGRGIGLGLGRGSGLPAVQGAWPGFGRGIRGRYLRYGRGTWRGG